MEVPVKIIPLFILVQGYWSWGAMKQDQYLLESWYCAASTFQKTSGQLIGLPEHLGMLKTFFSLNRTKRVWITLSLFHERDWKELIKCSIKVWQEGQQN